MSIKPVPQVCDGSSTITSRARDGLKKSRVAAANERPRPASDPEGAFALLERLSELERVQIVGRSILGLDEPAVRSLLATAAPHLAELDRLQAKLAPAQPADREYLELRHPAAGGGDRHPGDDARPNDSVFHHAG